MAAKADFYQLLESPRDATAAQIKKAYRRLAKKYHPDRNGKPSRKTEDRFKDISHAYDVLSDVEARKRYDAELRAKEAPPTLRYREDAYPADMGSYQPTTTTPGMEIRFGIRFQGGRVGSVYSKTATPDEMRAYQGYGPCMCHNCLVMRTMYSRRRRRR